MGPGVVRKHANKTARDAKEANDSRVRGTVRDFVPKRARLSPNKIVLEFYTKNCNNSSLLRE